MQRWGKDEWKEVQSLNKEWAAELNQVNEEMIGDENKNQSVIRGREKGSEVWKKHKWGQECQNKREIKIFDTLPQFQGL